MTKFCVCFKITADLDQLQVSDYVVTSDLGIDTSFVKTTYNCYDESCLEFGVRLSARAESLTCASKLTAVTLGNHQVEPYLKTLAALRYDNMVHIAPPEGDYRFRPDTVVEGLLLYLNVYPQDFILMGRQAPEGNNFATPQLLAQALDVPLVPNVVDLQLIEDGLVEVVSELEGQFITQTIQAPAVLTLGNAEVSKLRVPTLKDRMQYGKHPIEQVEASVYTGNCGVEALSFVDSSRHGTVVEGKGETAVETLCAQYLERWRETL